MVNKMQELLNKVNQSDMNDINLYLFSKPRKRENFEVFSTIIDDDEVKKDMKHILQDQIRNYITNDNYETIDYNPLFEEKGIVQFINCDELEYLPKFIDKICLDCVVYDEKKLRKGHELWLAVIVIDNGKDKIISFQKLRSKTLLKNEKILFSFDRKLKKVNSPLLQLEQKMDCICYLDNNNELHNQTMYIFDKYNFELIFGFERKFKKEINEMLKKLEENESYDVNLLNLQQLYYKVENNKNHLKKLYVILKNDSFRYLTNENIEKIENKSNIKFNRPTGKLELETNDDVKKILNFLNDDFLEGIISEKPFLSSNKRDI